MNIDEAILILEPSDKRPMFLDKSKIIEATKLGIAALKQVKESRFDPSTWTPQTLPGETAYAECHRETGIRAYPDCIEDCDYHNIDNCPLIQKIRAAIHH